MRHDMAKVVTEKPRRGSRYPSKKFGGRVNIKDDYEDDDFGPSGFIPWCRRRNQDWKEFSDLLGPLRRYFRSQVGRDWNDIWSEVSSVLDKRSLTGIHIFDHIRMEVHQNCWMSAQGKVFRRLRYSSKSEPVTGLYVHPETNQ